jgi:hypothetical protein
MKPGTRLKRRVSKVGTRLDTSNGRNRLLFPDLWSASSLFYLDCHDLADALPTERDRKYGYHARLHTVGTPVMLSSFLSCPATPLFPPSLTSS